MLRQNQKVVSFPRDRINAVREIDLNVDQFLSALLLINEHEVVCILDSCATRHLGSHLLIAGVRPVEVLEVAGEDVTDTLRMLDDRFSGELAAIFTLSYAFGRKLQEVSAKDAPGDANEPDVFLALFDVLIIHDYDTGRTFLTGNEQRFDQILDLATEVSYEGGFGSASGHSHTQARSNFPRSEYHAAVEQIREHIRAGNTYQTNLTQQLRVPMPEGVTPRQIFSRLRRDHPAPFAAFLVRSSSTVVSASPERFFRVTKDKLIEAAPIKGTRRRGKTIEEDERFRRELESSEKDRAENTMIVDLVRNDLGRVCEFGSVAVETLCAVEEHPSLFHLVSTIRGQLRPEVKFSEILRAVFPCGSITGAPKIRTMEIIDQIETADRGLSMGAIGCFIPPSWPQIGDTLFDVSVAIRTMVIRDSEITFNVGGGVVIDSDPEKEYEESLLKAKALLTAIGIAPDTGSVIAHEELLADDGV